MRHSHAHKHRPATGHHHPHSYASTGPAGGRPASGLSSRRRATSSTRGAFRGPPPSFYRQGGYGAHAGKRKAAHDQTTNRAEARAREASSSTSSSSSTGTSGSTSTNSDYYTSWSSSSTGGGGGGGGSSRHIRDDVPHFDSFSHERTHMRQEQRRARRRMDKGEVHDESDEGSAGPSFGSVLVIGGVLAAGGLIPLLISRVFGSSPQRPPTKKKRRVTNSSAENGRFEGVS